MASGKLSVIVLSMFAFFICLSLKGQEAGMYAKVSPVLARTLSAAKRNITIPVRLIISGKSTVHGLRRYLYKTVTDSVFSVDINIYGKQPFDSVSKLSGLIYIDAKRTAKEELEVNNSDLSTNAITAVHDQYPELNGDGITVSIKETRVDTNDIDLRGRYKITEFAPRVSSSHATIMATMLAGAGNSGAAGKGVASAATVTSSSYDNLFPDPPERLKANNITVQNHSYGVGIENYYGADAAAYDANAITDSVLLHVFSAGNSGLLKDSAGQYPAGYANLTGSFKMAKNIICVGSTDSFRKVLAPSSRGPAFDGRVKPELVAYGIDGSSGAAALVSGAAVLLQQQYRNRFKSLPSSALVKAILINSADDLGNAGPDYVSGYGSLNVLNAVNHSNHFQGSLASGETKRFLLPVLPGATAIKCTLVWNDPPASPNAGKALINDLDLELRNISTGEITRPWVLNALTDELTRPAVRGRDTLNNVEQISAAIQPGSAYELIVRTHGQLKALQSFYIAWQYELPNLFTWESPVKSLPLVAGETAVFRWKSTYGELTGKFSWSNNAGRSWRVIDANVDLNRTHYEWSIPLVNTLAIFRMELAADTFITDTMVIAEKISTGIGFNCADSLLFYWNKSSGINNYRWYRLGEKYMEASPVINDSFVVINKSNNPSVYYAAAPIINGRIGPRSSALNYTQQGVGCYFRSFLVSPENNSIQSRFLLGTLFNVKRIALEKMRSGRYVVINEFQPAPLMSFIFNDTTLVSGLNTYRVKIELASGNTIYSAEESIFHFAGKKYVIYPNPLRGNRKVSIAQNNVAPARLEIYNFTGLKLHEQLIDDRINEIGFNRFSKGIYFFRITSEDGKSETVRVVNQ